MIAFGAVVAKYNVTPVDTGWVDTDKAFQEEPMHIRSQMVAESSKAGIARLGCGNSSARMSESRHIHCRES